jgi:hypothetical protein
MTNPVVHAFFVGRALAQGLNEQLERSLTDALSEFGKFDAEQREKLRDFSNQVLERAEREAAAQAPTPTGANSSGSGTGSSEDLQELLDNLRAEIAQLRTKLQDYRSR